MNRLSSKKRCAWAETHDMFIPYHDTEWGVPVHDDQLLFEMLTLEGAQAGLSWLTILKKRENYRKAFDNFDAQKIAKYSEAKKSALLQNEGIVRNRLKIAGVVENAKTFLFVQKEYGSFDTFIWSFTHGNIISHRKRKEAIKISEVMSVELKKRGFTFVGATICYAFMQAVGMVSDHEPYCFCAK